MLGKVVAAMADQHEQTEEPRRVSDLHEVIRLLQPYGDAAARVSCSSAMSAICNIFPPLYAIIIMLYFMERLGGGARTDHSGYELPRQIRG